MVDIKQKVKESCDGCRFCQENDAGQIECRRRSPVPLPMQKKSPLGQMDFMVMTLWPPVRSELWCGDYQPAQFIH